ncbi:hypothetical protein IPO96_01840 [Candidatus Saccharibacteria bacterium]|jgi:hypothetical protein|nr:MAG: hypothetical protein IPO96_01840 [Candidatus Saccharibacteria bacterium]
MKNIFKRMSLALSTVLITGLIAAPVIAAPDIQNKLCEGANLEVGAGTTCDATSGEANVKINETITFVINMFSLVVGVVAVIMIIIAGFKYITSGGDSGNVTSAKNTILYAIIGLVVVALSQFIVKFVLGRITTTIS